MGESECHYAIRVKRKARARRRIITAVKERDKEN